MEQQLAAFAAAHPYLLLVLAGALLVTSAINATTNKISEEQLRAMERDQPRQAGLIWLTRGAGGILHWIARGIVLLVAPSLLGDRGTPSQRPPAPSESAPPTPRNSGEEPRP